MYTCIIAKRDYSEFSYSPEWGDTDIKLLPSDLKLFHEDVFSCENGKIDIINSPTRNNKNIPGVLLLENNRTFGRTNNKKKLYYKCRPNNPHLPYFLIPYDMPMGFSKSFKNKYITFSFISWNEKHPCGMVSQNLGDVYHLPSFYEYQLYCKNLHSPITKAISETKKKLQLQEYTDYFKTIENCPEKYGVFETTDAFVFAIDPDGCLDRDDALSIQWKEQECHVTVYISNVWVWLEVLDLWDFIGSRVSTIYFPTFKRPMLPTSIGETLCSLDENKDRFVFAMDFVYSFDDNNNKYTLINTPIIKQMKIKVSKSYVYEEKALLKNKNYGHLLNITKQLTSVENSHDVVAYWMMQMNTHTAKLLKTQRIGIFRTVKGLNISPAQSSPDTIPTFVRIWEQKMAGKYVHCIENMEHQMLGVAEYTHFTSPIRRLPDLLNQIWLICSVIRPTQLNDHITTFLNVHSGNLDELNAKMKTIRRIQSDSYILERVMNQDSLLDKKYDGIVLCNEKLEGKIQLFIEELQWITLIPATRHYENYEKVQCSLFLFEKEDQMRKKIRAMIVV